MPTAANNDFGVGGFLPARTVAFASNFKVEGTAGAMVGFPVSFALVGIYVTTVLFYKQFHEPRAGEKSARAAWVKPVSIAHHGLLAVFSGVWFVLMGRSFLDVCNAEGWHVCMDTWHKGAAAGEQGGLWTGWSGWFIWVFMVSKFYELGDTAIVMGKGYRIIFLHWFHHATVPVLCAVHASEPNSAVWTELILDALVHTVMHTYYTCVAAGIRVPFKSLVTSMQLVQFVTVVAHFSYLLATHGFWAFPLMFLGGYSVYLTYLLLFVRFFVQAYVTKTAPGAASASAKTAKAASNASAGLKGVKQADGKPGRRRPRSRSTKQE